MSVKTYQIDRNYVAEIQCEIDHHFAKEIREKIDKEVSRSNCKNIIFDFTNVNFMDSSGIGMIIGRYKLIENKGGKVCAININESLARIFEISGLKKIIPIFKNLEEALKEV